MSSLHRFAVRHNVDRRLDNQAVTREQKVVLAVNRYLADEYGYILTRAGEEAIADLVDRKSDVPAAGEYAMDRNLVAVL